VTCGSGGSYTVWPCAGPSAAKARLSARQRARLTPQGERAKRAAVKPHVEVERLDHERTFRPHVGLELSAAIAGQESAQL
jgi:hypothetical protein